MSSTDPNGTTQGSPGPEAARPDTAGSDSAGPNSARSNSARSNSAGPYRIERFAPALDGGRIEALSRGFCAAVEFGFHGPATDAATLGTFIAGYHQDEPTWTGVYTDSSPEGAWDTTVPVATYASMTKTMNIGAGRLLDTHLVTAVTVRPTHRRRGLLRRLMSDDLRLAQQRGLAMAALTASEATIYGRFGFGAASWVRRVEVDVAERFAITAPAAGLVEPADPAVLLELGPELFAGFHGATTGSVGRQESDRQRIAGRWSGRKAEPDPAVRAALHYGGSGAPDGYVSYKFSGWDSPERTMKVIDLVAVNEPAYLELWRYLGSIDLIRSISVDHAPASDPLPWAMADRRGYKVIGEEDLLWLRILDVAAALQARSYAADGIIILAVTDPLDLAAGTYRLEVTDGSARVERATAGTAADVQLSVNDLGSLYLGGAETFALAAAGRVSGSASSLEKLDRLIRTGRRPYCMTEF